jgi:hypothetical protein
MTKSIALLPRRADFTRRRFQEYYETRHAPLAIGYFRFSKYVRSHLIGQDDIGFDTISEFWNEDIERLAALMQGEIGEIMRADERCFMNRDTIRSGASEETLVHGPPRIMEVQPTVRTAWLLRRGGALDRDDLQAAASAWGRAVAAASGTSCERVTLDVISAWGEAFPFDAILWFWMHEEAEPVLVPAPAGVVPWQEVLVESHETPPETMAAALLARQRGA